LRFTVHRPPHGEVSLCWHRPPGGDVAGSVHVGVARPHFAGDARENRLALAVFGRDVPTLGASLRRVRGGDPLHAPRGFVVEAGYRPTPCLMSDRPIEGPLLGDPNTWMCKRASRRARHRPHVEALHPNSVEPARQISCSLLQPVPSSIYFAGFESGDRQFGALSAIGAALGSRKASLEAAQPNLLAGRQARGMQQLSSGQCHRHHHPAVDANYAAILRPRDRVGDVRECDMPAPGPITGDAVRLHTRGHGLRPTESDPSSLWRPHACITPIEPFDLVRPEANLPKALIYAGLAPRRTTMSASEEILRSLSEIPRRLLLHRRRPATDTRAVTRPRISIAEASRRKCPVFT
jgi:hypothetical protein